MSVVLLKLNKHNQDLLKEILDKSGHSELIQVKSMSLYCKSTDREKLRQLVLDEFCETGLKADDEPNARGLELENLIDAIGAEE